MKHHGLVIGTVIAAIAGAGAGWAQEAKKGNSQSTLLEAFDSNHDGVLSPAEIEAATAKLRELAAKKATKPSDRVPKVRRGGRGGRGPTGGDKVNGPEREETAQKPLHRSHRTSEPRADRDAGAHERNDREPKAHASASESDGHRRRQSTAKDRKSGTADSSHRRGGRHRPDAKGDSVTRRAGNSAAVHGRRPRPDHEPEKPASHGGTQRGRRGDKQTN